MTTKTDNSKEPNAFALNIEGDTVPLLNWWAKDQENYSSLFAIPYGQFARGQFARPTLNIRTEMLYKEQMKDTRIGPDNTHSLRDLRFMDSEGFNVQRLCKELQYDYFEACRKASDQLQFLHMPSQIDKPIFAGGAGGFLSSSVAPKNYCVIKASGGAGGTGQMLLPEYLLPSLLQVYESKPDLTHRDLSELFPQALLSGSYARGDNHKSPFFGYNRIVAQEYWDIKKEYRVLQSFDKLWIYKRKAARVVASNKFKEFKQCNLTDDELRKMDSDAPSVFPMEFSISAEPGRILAHALKTDLDIGRVVELACLFAAMANCPLASYDFCIYNHFGYSESKSHVGLLEWSPEFGLYGFRKDFKIGLISHFLKNCIELRDQFLNNKPFVPSYARSIANHTPEKQQ